MKKPLVYIILSAFFYIVFSLETGAQTTFKNQDELKAKADEYYTAEDYVSAMPLYSQLVSLYPKDPTYNYRFGVCLLYADRRDNEKPIKYLEFASAKDGVDESVFYYLGMAYHENYRFADAIKEYNIYKDKAASKSVAKLDVVRQIEICNSAISLLSTISDLYVIQKTEVTTSDFFRSYDVERFGGKILVKPDIFKTPLDKKKEKFSLCFFSKESNEVYYSSYGKDGKTGKDIYKSTKLKDGTWSKPESLGSTINTPYDEDFPFLLPDGSTLYYSSNGGNTIGGYDIFTSTLGETGTWSTPENLNYPINTPFDDIMFVPDSSGQYAYFSSERASMEGMITVYRVRIDTRPKIDELLVFNKPDNTSENDSAYNQTIQFLKEKSTLDVNATESMFASKNNIVADNSNNNQQDTSDETDISDNMSNQDIINLAEKQALQSQKELSDLKTKRQAAWTIATNRKSQSEKKYKEAETITNNAANLTDEDAKKTQQSKAATVKSEAEQLNKEAVVASNIASQLDKQVAAKQKETDEALKYAKDIKTAVQSNSTDSSIAMLERMTEKLQNAPSDTGSYEKNPSEDFIEKKAKEAEDLYVQSESLQKEINSLNDQVANNKKKADNTKKKSEKEQYLQQANDYEAEAKSKQNELDEILQKSEKVQYEGDSAKSQSDIYASLVEDIQNNNTSSVSSTNNQMTASNTNSNQTNSTSTNSSNTNNTSTNNQTLANNNTNTSNTNNTNTVTNNTNQNTANNTADNSSTNNQTTANNNTNNTTSNNTLSKNDIVTQADKVITSVNASLDSIKKQADNAYAVAYNDNMLSLKKQKEADNLKADASETANTDEKEKYLKKADELSKESVELARKAVVAYSLAEYLDDEYDKKKEESSTVTSLVQKAKDNANSGDLSDAKDVLNQAKTEQSKLVVSGTADLYKSQLSNSLDSKQYEMEQAQDDADKLQKKADSLSNKAKDLRTQANNTKKQSQKNELINQAEQVELQLNTAQKDANTAYDNVDAINEEVSEMKMKVNYSTSLANETEIYVKPANTTVDKAALEKDITQYENNNVFSENAASTKENNSTNDNTTNSTSDNTNNVSNNTSNINNANNTTSNVTANNNTAVNNTNTASNNTTANNTSTSNNNTATSNTTNNSNSSVSSDLTTLSNPQQIESKADMIDQTIVTIRTRIKALQGELKEVTDNNDKTDINKDISQLQNELTDLQEQSDKTHNEAKDKNNSQEVANTNTDYNTLSLNLQNEASNDLDNATELRKEANNTTNQVMKDSLRKEAVDLEKIAGNKNIESYEIKNLGNTNDYYTNSSLADSIKKNTANNTQTNSAESLLNESEYYFDKSQALKKTINDSMSYTEKKSVYNDILSNEKTAIDKQQKAIDIYKQQTTTYANNTTTNNTSNNSNSTNVTENNNVTNNNSTVVNNNTANTNNTVANNSANTNNTSNTTADNTNAGNTITPNDFKGIYLDANNNTPLNVDAANLVPLDASLPTGIVFKVQFCALNKHVSPDVFTGITPVTGESTTFGIYRYLAGLFAKYDDAVAARDLIRPKGYADAFVVAYNNGKRITVGEALALLKADNSLSTTYADLNNKNYVSSGTTNTATGNTATTAVLSNPVSKISGLFYSVQVGVYVKPVTSAQLFNITPLYDEIMANGYYRYLSGTYTSLQDAVAAKNTIVTKGVTDAFVVVYYNGKKITFAEAKTLQAGNANLAITNNNTTSTNNNTNTTVTNNGISFKVQVGAYHKELTDDQITQYLSAAVDKGLEHATNDYGLVVYTSGNFTDYKSASDYKITLVAKGLTDAYIVAFNGKEKIAVNKAIEMLK